MTSAQQALDRGMPASPDAERSILGAILLDNTLGYDTLRTLRPEHYSLDAHRRIYAAMASLAEGNRPVDIITVTEVLNSRKELEAVGGVAYVAALTDGVPRRPSIDQYIKIVRGKATLRSLIHACNSTMAEAIDQQEHPEKLVSRMEDTLIAMRADDGGELPDIKKQVAETLEAWHEERSSQREILGLTTCIDDLDLLTTGIRPGELWFLAAPPARAKTAYALQILRRNAMRGEPCAMFSLEMKGDPVFRRCVAAIAGVKAGKTRDMRRPSPTEWPLIQEAMATMAGWPLILDEKPLGSLRQLISKARLYVRRSGAKLIVVDHLKALSMKSPGREERDRINYAGNALRELAYDENVGVLALHHINRSGYTDPDERPNMGHLKESGDLEGFAHVILMLWREQGQDSYGRKCFTENAEVIAAKIRDGGEMGSFNARFNKDTLEYEAR